MEAEARSVAQWQWPILSRLRISSHFPNSRPAQSEWPFQCYASFQPLRYSRRMNWSAARVLVAWSFAESHTSFSPAR